MPAVTPAPRLTTPFGYETTAAEVLDGVDLSGKRHRRRRRHRLAPGLQRSARLVAVAINAVVDDQAGTKRPEVGSLPLDLGAALLAPARPADENPVTGRDELVGLMVIGRSQAPSQSRMTVTNPS